MGSPLRSPLRKANPAASSDPSVDPLPRPSSRETAALSNPAPRLPSPQGSPLRPPALEDGRPPRPGPVPSRPSMPIDPHVRPPSREEDRSAAPTAPRLFSLLQGSPAGSPAHEVGRPVGQTPAPWLPPPGADSPPRDGGRAITDFSYADAVEKPPSPTTPIVNRAAARDGPPAVTKVEKGEGGARGLRDRSGSERGSRAVSWILQRRQRGETLGRAAIAVRVAAVVLCLVSFSVMAADKTKGWAGDSFDRYREYRFCITVNILTFLYSGFQAYAQVLLLVYGKNIIRPSCRYYFDFAMDQVLAYLLLAASSAAATLNNDWISNWGNDPFTVMANGSISVSFLAFAALAVSALISAHILFSSES